MQKKLCICRFTRFCHGYVDDIYISDVSKRNERRKTDHLKTILVYNSFFGDATWGLPMGDALFEKHQCPIRTCTITTNKSHHADSHAVLFHGEALPMPPPQKYPQQEWLFFDMECPQKYKLIANDKQ